jgi:uncharacterized protein YdaL
MVALPTICVGSVFAFTDDGLVPGEGSSLAQEFATAAPETPHTSSPTLSRRYGLHNGVSTLVLDDDTTPREFRAEVSAIAAGNLATHFGEAEVVPIREYTPGRMAGYTAVIYVGVSADTVVPQAFVDDVRAATVPVIWLGANSDSLARSASLDESFASQYGWSPDAPLDVASRDVTEIRYKGQDLPRAHPSDATIWAPGGVQPGVEVVATATCAVDASSPGCRLPSGTGSHSVPWAIRSKNLTYVAEVPLSFINENGGYLVFADLLHPALAPGRGPVSQAAVRIEDVNPESDPSQLRAFADYFAARKIPFQVAVIPILVDHAPGRKAPYALSLSDEPDVVEALKYMQDRGGTLIQHGTTHQYGNLPNPYSGRSGDDYEFFLYGCSATETPPYRWESCGSDSWVEKRGPLPDDTISAHRTRLEQGRQVMIDAGLGAPTIFETPHYSASVNAYLAMSEIYDARYEQAEYWPGSLTSAVATPDDAFEQFFPYTVHDIYGTTVYPEDLENPTLTAQNNHPARSAASLVQRAKRNLVVTDATASFFFHPFLKLSMVDEIVTGIEDLGYRFVPVSELQ